MGLSFLGQPLYSVVGSVSNFQDFAFRSGDDAIRPDQLTVVHRFDHTWMRGPHRQEQYASATGLAHLYNIVYVPHVVKGALSATSPRSAHDQTHYHP